MGENPVIGERILRPLPGLAGVAVAVRHEHERWDGGGYPEGLAGAAIPLASRIVLACDAWHALVSDRPYRRALSRDSARAELVRCSGTQFDPRVLEVFADDRTADLALVEPAARTLALHCLYGGVPSDLSRSRAISAAARADTFA